MNAPSFDKRLASVALLLGLVWTPAFAGSSAASSASDSITTSVGSVSGSIQRSSNSSSNATPVAAGDYRIIEVAAVPEQPGTVRLTLQGRSESNAEVGFALLLPQAAFAGSGLGQGGDVTLLARSYGLEFTNAATKEAFYMVVSDDGYRELQTVPVEL
jgi:hypothetical protein